MKLQDQVCSFEFAKKLKELGVKQDSLYVWAVEMKMGKETQNWFIDRVEYLLPEHSKYSAFTVAELGQLLPYNFTVSRLKNGEYLPEFNFLIFGISMKQLTEIIQHFEGIKTEADARAKLLIYLIENKLLTITEEKT